MRLGILDTLGLAATLVFAIPIAFVGVRLLLQEQFFLGGFLLLTAGLMVYLQRVATTPEDIPIKIAEKLTGGLVKPPEEDEAEATDTDEGEGLLSRLR
ncbi:DUF7533 family protein [Salinirubrum litoreum]|uniref:Uncharacterized protein n=1 Tax=Salinirubrum litoreum TaxID=1126234 RepID=A0ABD5RC59_9EURY|nr:hypothetical protein [Salinirubrum litoreum]